MKKKSTILVVDDDLRSRRLLGNMLVPLGYEVILARDGEEAIGKFQDVSPDLVLLDVMMPKMDGYTVCQRIREFSQVPIIVVTAKRAEDEKIEGLDVGADDYVTKPFSMHELAARIRAALRRASMGDGSAEPVFSHEGLTVDFDRHIATLNGTELNLSATEYGLLSYLARNAGGVITPDQILERVWGEEYIGEHHLLQVNISRLRKKLCDDPRGSRYILTKAGIGYTMKKPACLLRTKNRDL
jgi:DNA-binding response OmpR family regulator